MKNFLAIMVLLIASGTTYAQSGCKPPTFLFNNLTSSTGSGGVNSTYTFTNVTTGVNAVITITKAQNATTSNRYIDVAAPYASAWQPFITFPSSRSNNSDSSYLEFKIEFRKNTAPFGLIDENCMAMTIIDCDGSGSSSGYREMVKVALPGSAKGVANSTISVTQDPNWILYKAGPAVFQDIDTLNLAAMGQTNFPANLNTFRMRVGVVGKIDPGLQRQFSFYFKSFAALVVPLPVEVINYRAELSGRNALVKWMTVDEKNMDKYEIYRSFDGKDFSLAGNVKAKNQQIASEYLFEDKDILTYQESQVFYRLRTIDRNGTATWGNIGSLSMDLNGSSTAIVYPNPATDILHIDLGVHDYPGFTAELVDVYGKIVSTIIDPDMKGNAFVIDIETLEKGIYFIHIVGHDGYSSDARFIKY
jgi:hypothetical protein